jgi:hypothetical protein
MHGMENMSIKFIQGSWQASVQLTGGQKTPSFEGSNIFLYLLVWTEINKHRAFHK